VNPFGVDEKTEQKILTVQYSPLELKDRKAQRNKI